MPRTRKAKVPPAPALPVCAECGQEKPPAAFRRLADGRWVAGCRACRPALPVAGWRAREFATAAARRGAIREAARRRAAKAREGVPLGAVVVAAPEPSEAPEAAEVTDGV